MKWSSMAAVALALLLPLSTTSHESQKTLQGTAASGSSSTGGEIMELPLQADTADAPPAIAGNAQSAASEASRPLGRNSPNEETETRKSPVRQGQAPPNSASTSAQHDPEASGNSANASLFRWLKGFGYKMSSVLSSPTASVGQSQQPSSRQTSGASGHFQSRTSTPRRPI